MAWTTRLLRLNPWKHKRDKRLRQYRETEEHEVMDAILRHRAERDEKERQIDLELFREGRKGSNHLINREMRMLRWTLDYQRALIAARVEIRKRLALECPELLSDAQLSKLEETMLGFVQLARQARRDDYQRRAVAAGVPVLRPEERDAAEYGELEALIRREIRQLSLARSLGRLGGKKQWGSGLWSRSRGIRETLDPFLEEGGSRTRKRVRHHYARGLNQLWNDILIRHCHALLLCRVLVSWGSPTSDRPDCDYSDCLVWQPNPDILSHICARRDFR